MGSAYTAIVEKGWYSIGRADEGTRGYTPQPHLGKFDTYDAAEDAANVINEKAGYTKLEACRIVIRTMRK